MDVLLDPLTEAQRAAVTHTDGPLLILAGPGSGKTRVVTHRIAHLMREGIADDEILALTFTNKAAEEMKSRVAGLAPEARVWVSTFHRFCARLLRQHAALVGLAENYTIYDSADSMQLLRLVIRDLQIDMAHVTPERIAHAISWAKNNLITAAEYEATPGNSLGGMTAAIYPAYQARLTTANAVDFDDLLLHTAVLLREAPELRARLDERFRYIMVDEYQDTNLAQYAIVRALSLDQPNLAVTGDPDQSIYGWRGANLSNILEFEKDFPQVSVVRLEQSYRSTKRILRVAAELIAHNLRRKQKELFTENDEGASVRLVNYATQKIEAEGVAATISAIVRSSARRPRDFAIFYRVNALSRSLEFALRDQGVPYQMVNGVEFFQRKEIKDILAYLTVINNPRDDVSLLRVINTPPRGIGKKTITHIAEHARRRGLCLLEAARESGTIPALSKRAPVAVAKFVSMMDRLSLLADRPVEEILGHVLSESGYRAPLVESEDPADQDRLANVEELLTAAREFDLRESGEGRLEEFLEEVCLVNDTDGWDAADDRVTLMTLHASKGLEFPVVFIIALEEGILPHERSRERQDQLEEERRLLFVGITRAQEELQLSRTDRREFRGRTAKSVPSSFLMELPRGELETIDELGDVSPVDDFAFEFRPKRRTERVNSGPALTTAAELASSEDAAAERAAISPDVFHQGMLVLHPEYGLGTIVALSGNGQNRTGTINFTAVAGPKKFVLSRSKLRPVKAP